MSTTEENETQGRVSDAVARVNSRFSTLTYQPIVFLPTPDLTFSQYLGLLTVADAFLVTSLREGMALRTHEFVECQEGKYGALILSEVCIGHYFKIYLLLIVFISLLDPIAIVASAHVYQSILGIVG